MKPLTWWSNKDHPTPVEQMYTGCLAPVFGGLDLA